MITTHWIVSIIIVFNTKCVAQDIIVIGAGISGLGAARTLVDHGGYNVTILEANPDRYGGRIYTTRDVISDGSGKSYLVA